MALMVGSGDVCVWGSPESSCRFYVGAFGSNLASVAVKIFSALKLVTACFSETLEYIPTSLHGTITQKNISLI